VQSFAPACSRSRRRILFTPAINGFQKSPTRRTLNQIPYRPARSAQAQRSNGDPVAPSPISSPSASRSKPRPVDAPLYFLRSPSPPAANNVPQHKLPDVIFHGWGDAGVPLSRKYRPSSTRGALRSTPAVVLGTRLPACGRRNEFAGRFFFRAAAGQCEVCESEAGDGRVLLVWSRC